MVGSMRVSSVVSIQKLSNAHTMAVRVPNNIGGKTNRGYPISNTPPVHHTITPPLHRQPHLDALDTVDVLHLRCPRREPGGIFHFLRPESYMALKTNVGGIDRQWGAPRF